MDSIVVGFSRPSGWFEPFSWLIRLAYWSPFSHTYVKFNFSNLNKNMIFQASGLEVNLIGEPLFDSREVIYKEFTFPLSTENRIAFLQFAMDQLGKPYSLTGILGMTWVRICQLFGRAVTSPIKYNGSSDFCSELVAYILQNFEGVNVGKNPASLSPKDVYNIVSKINS